MLGLLYAPDSFAGVEMEDRDTVEHDESESASVESENSTSEEGILCPSGLRIAVRKMKLREYKLFANNAGMRSGASIDEVLAACTTVIDPGPAYAPGTFNWKTTALQGDRFFTQIQIRSCTHGSKFNFDAKCPECRKKIAWTVNLTDLPVVPYPTESRRKNAARERFALRVAGKLVEFTLLTAEDEKRLVKIVGDRAEEDAVVESLAYRMRSVEGVSRKDPKVFREWLEDLDMEEVFAIRAEIDRVSGGVETSIGIECSRCGEFQINLPFGGAGFWTPKSTRSRESSIE